MWNKESIQKLLAENDRAVQRAVVSIYRLQTDQEKNSKATREANGVGFSAFDAEFLTDMAQRCLKGYGLTPKQMAVTRNKMMRYHRQLVELANANERAKAAVELEAPAMQPIPESDFDAPDEVILAQPTARDWELMQQAQVW